MTVAELMLVRHGESTGNVAREEAEASGAEVIPVEARDADVGLTDLGVRQARELGRYLATVDPEPLPTSVWTSTYTRARQTAECIVSAAGMNLRPLRDERLRDKELGVLDALTSHGVRMRYPWEADRRRWLGKFYYRAPGGESWADLALRLRSVLLDVDRVEPDGARVLLVTHDAVISVLRYICEGLDEDEVLTLARTELLVNTGLTRLRRDADGQWVVVVANQQDHLLPDFAGSDLRTAHPGGGVTGAQGPRTESA